MSGAEVLNLLLLEDSESDEALVLTQLRRGGFEPRCVRVESRRDFAEALKRGPWDVIIVDFNLPSFNGLEALELYKSEGIDVPFILVSGTVGEDIAVEALKAGGHDYMLKDRLVRLVPAVRRELREARGRAVGRRVEKELHRSMELFSRTFRASPDAMAIVEIDGGRVIEANECYGRLFGTSEAPGDDHRLPGGWEDPGSIGTMMERLLERGSFREFEARRRSPSGSVTSLLVSAERLKMGSRQCAVFVFRDVTEWRKAQASSSALEAQLRQSQKLEAIGRLAGGIAHDFNNILAAIMGNAQLADMDLEAEHPAKENIQQALTAAIRARELIKQIMVFSRHGEERRQPTHLNSFVSDSLRLLRATVPSTIEVIRVVPDRVPPILANSTQLLQVLLNLTANAVQAMDERGGRLELAVEVSRIGPAEASANGVEPGEFVVLKVADSGIGMDENVLEHIFEPFFTTKEPGKGTGLGLALIHGIVKQHGGYVRVISALGRGTTFSLFFPVLGETAGSARPAPSAPAPLPTTIGQGKRILVLDDEAGVCEMVKNVLLRFGYGVDPFSDPALALSAFREAPSAYSLVITDLTMPRLKGTGVAEAIWRIRPALPILLTTGYGSAAEFESFRAMGLRGPLTKPFLAEDVVAAVSEALAG